MADLVDNYLDRLTARQFSPATIKAYRQDLRLCEQAIGKPLVRATEDDLERYMADLTRAGLKATTIRRKQSALRGFYQHCRRRRARKSNPADCLEPPKIEERLPVHLSRGQLGDLSESLRGDTPADRRHAALVLTLIHTGMRAAELMGLTFDDLFLSDRELRVFGKGRKERMLPISDALHRALRRWLEVHPTGEGAVFVSLRYPHRPLRHSGVDGVVRKAMASAGLNPKRFSPHKCRHTFATRLINSKMPIEKIQKLLGHKQIGTTTIYAHTEMGDDLRNAIGEALE